MLNSYETCWQMCITHENKKNTILGTRTKSNGHLVVKLQRVSFLILLDVFFLNIFKHCHMPKIYLIILWITLNNLNKND